MKPSPKGLNTRYGAIAAPIGVQPDEKSDLVSKKASPFMISRFFITGGKIENWVLGEKLSKRLSIC
ncbi:MAG: hypothetical protein WD016_11955 [Balneolaceae bacterium]